MTQIETWIRDPYAIYARRLLRLEPLDDPGAPVGPREVGSLLHRVFERAAKEPAAAPVAALRTILDEEAPRAGLVGADRAFWSCSLEEALAWFAAFDADRREMGKAFVEQKGALTLTGVEPPFTLTARADRIDVLSDGAAAIFDYKLTSLPTEKQDETFSPQLSLTAAMVAGGGFDAIGPARVASYRYLRAANRKGDKSDEAGRDGADAEAAAQEAIANLKSWIARFDDARAAYLSQPRPQFIKHEGDYDQLARRREWMASEDAGGDGE